MHKLIRIIILISVFLLLNFSADQALAQEIERQINIFNLNGELINTVSLKNLDWLKIGDLEIADLGNDHIPEIIISAPAGEKPTIKIYRLDGSLINEFLVYPEAYQGGVNFEIADLDGDGYNDLITGATKNGGSHLRILNRDGKELNSFFVWENDFKGGVNVAVGNLLGDQIPEIAVSSNQDQRLKIFNYRGALLKQLTLANNLTSGQRIKLADLGNDGVSEIITYANAGDQPVVNVYENSGQSLNSFTIFDQKFLGGIDLETAGNQIIAAAGSGGGPHLKIIDSYNQITKQFFADQEDFLGGSKIALFQNQLYLIPELFRTGTKPDKKYVEIDLADQRLKYFSNGFQLGDFIISSGRQSLPTPTGEFSILEKNPLAYSKKYNLYMPYWQSFKIGYGIHELPYWGNGYREGENHLGTPVSHGCVRLGIGPAKELYNFTELGTKVYIYN